MSAIFGVMGVDDTEAGYLDSFGSGLIFDAINEVLSYHNADVAKATSVFVRRNTEKYQERWMLPGAGLLSPAGQDPFGPGPSVMRVGEVDVAYPLRGYEEALSQSRVAVAYSTLQELDAQIDTITERSMAQHRQRMMIALMESTNLVFGDIKHGNINVVRLANNDGSLYPPIPGAAAEADDQHYIDAAYDVAGIAAATNPAVDLRNEIIEHFGGRATSGTGTNIVYFHGADQTALLAAIAGYVPVGDWAVNWGADTDLAKLRDGIPGWLHGRGWGVYLAEWAWMPAEFGMAVHLDYPPLERRVDTSASGLPAGLSLVAVDRDHPLQSSFYSERYGYGVRNRLSAACIEINAGGGAYTPPAAYAE